MRSVPVTIRVPQPLWDNREKLRQATGAKTVNAMLVGMLRYAYLHGKEHTVSNALADLPLDVQDGLDDRIVEKFLAGESLHGSYLEHLVNDSVNLLASQGKKITKKAVAQTVLSRILDGGCED